MKKLTETEVQERLAKTKNWELNKKGQIEKQFEFKDFKESMLFVDSVAFVAERLNHHPDILVLWNKVRLSVNTHDAQGLTELDFKLAGLVDGLLEIKRS